MKKPVIRLALAAVLLVAMACGGYALSGGDSLITLRYITESFRPLAVQKGKEAASSALQESYDAAKGELDELHQEHLAEVTGGEGLYSAVFQPRDWSEGDEIEVPVGSGVLLLKGTAQVDHNGAFVDVTTGEEASSGSRLSAGHRYLVGEDTQAVVTLLSGAAQLAVQGAYDYADGGVDATPFYDVCTADWFHGPVNYVYGNKLFSGMDEHHFGPAQAMNRAMLMTVLYQMAGAPKGEMEAADVAFADVAETAWYAPYVKWGASQGITAGTGENTFSPEQQVTRQQVVVLLYSFASRYLELELAGGTDLSAYQDLDQTADWSREAFAWAVAEGIISSSSADALTLSPQKNANRAEVATMLRAFAEKIL